ncbi:hypothetical protein [Lentzea guizhouensis]|uniref:hypothetical protein n=1 Tax=Lentzea guizhouensis TaxID=1586287 RepID=UPI001F31C021|nr:hypothetical protein [Lentzea guizhouensis]
MRRALADAGLDADAVDYVNGHGTGTPANDAMEKKVMRAVFGERAPLVPTSSIKSFIGHTLGAAGAVEAVASVLALRTATARSPLWTSCRTPRALCTWTWWCPTTTRSAATTPRSCCAAPAARASTTHCPPPRSSSPASDRSPVWAPASPRSPRRSPTAAPRSARSRPWRAARSRRARCGGT